MAPTWQYPATRIPGYVCTYIDTYDMYVLCVAEYVSRLAVLFVGEKRGPGVIGRAKPENKRKEKRKEIEWGLARRGGSCTKS